MSLISIELFTIFAILMISGILGVVVRRVLNKVKAARKTPDFIRLLCDALYSPLAWLIWGYAVLFTAETATIAIDIDVPSILFWKARGIFLVVLASWSLLSWKGKYEEVLKKRVSKKTTKAQDEQLLYAVSRILTIFVVLVSALIILDMLGVQVTALLAFGGIGGVAIGFAAKDIVANFFGGFMIHLNRHFTVGEWINSPNKNFEGTVEEIGWYMTRIRTFARQPMFIPNAIFIDAVIENPGRMYNRRIKETIGIRYNDVEKLQLIVDDIRTMLQNHPAIDTHQTLLVHFLTFGPHSLDLEVYCFTKTTDWGKWRDQQQEIFLEIAKIIKSHDAEIAFPTSTVHLEGAPEPRLNPRPEMIN